LYTPPVVAIDGVVEEGHSLGSFTLLIERFDSKALEEAKVVTRLLEGNLQQDHCQRKTRKIQFFFVPFLTNGSLVKRNDGVLVLKSMWQSADR